MASKRVAFVTGGSGFVGKHLIKRLGQEGFLVRALARGPQAEQAVTAAGATPIKGDLKDQQALKAGMDGAEVVFHLAAMFKMWGPREEFDSVNVGGAKALADAAVATPSVIKIVMLSAAAVVQGEPEPMLQVDERSPLQEPSFAPYSASKAAAEKILLATAQRRPGLQTVAIRPPMIWGADMPMLDHMVEVVRKGDWQWPDGGTQQMSTCHVDNLIDALLLAADRGQGAYFIADASEGTLKSVITGLLATRGAKADDKSIGFGIAWTFAGLLGFFWKLARRKGEPPITRQMLRLIGKSFTVNTHKARHELGYVPRVTWTQGINGMSHISAYLGDDPTLR